MKELLAERIFTVGSLLMSSQALVRKVHFCDSKCHLCRFFLLHVSFCKIPTIWGDSDNSADQLYFSLSLVICPWLTWYQRNGLFLSIYFVNDINFSKGFSYLGGPWPLSLVFLFLSLQFDNSCKEDYFVTSVSLGERQEYKAVFLEKACDAHHCSRW